MVTQISPNEARQIDASEVRRAFQLFAKDGQVIELRAIDATLYGDHWPYEKPRIIAGWFDKDDALITALPQIASAGGIYITINPCVPALRARANNRLKDKKVTATSDDQIANRQYLLLDADPEREGHVTGIPASDTEHQIALDFVQDMCEKLRSEGWPEPFRFDSGNGAYAGFAIDLPADDNGLVERVLKGLGQRFDTEQVHIDQTTFNQSRIMRLPGTWNCKGDEIEDRPHRMAKIIHIPDTMQSVPVELLEAIAGRVEQEQPKQDKKQTSKGTSRKKSNPKVKDFLEKHELATIREAEYKGGIKYLLAECPFCKETDNSACVYDTPMVEPYIGFSCSHNRCKDLTGKDLWLLFETPKEEPALVRLMKIVDLARLICTPSGALYARVPVNGHHEIVSIGEKGSGFRRWLVHRFKSEYGHAPNSDAISQVMSGVQADAEFIGEKAEIYTRVAEKDGCIYLDLANDKWQCVEIFNDGWRVITCPPVYFRRTSGMLPLPVPAAGGSLDDLKALINAKDDRDYKLITAWLVGTLHPKGPYPVLNLNGERGSAKTKTTTILRSIVDPSIAPTRNIPKDDREAAITAQNNMVIALDNLSSMPLWLSDLLCRIATGSGFSARELYSDDTERVFNNRRPIVMNGIEDGLITQGDLLNRTIMVTLTPPDAYRTEENIDELFKEKHPSILGALLTVVSVALRDRKKVQIEKPPRMADFATWIVASEPALGWQQGTFIEIYTENQNSASSTVVDSSPVAKAIVQYMAKNPTGWDGLLGDLLIELLKYDVYKNAKKVPKAANTLSGHLKRIAPSLREQEIDIQHLEHTKKGRRVSIQFVLAPPTGDDSGDDTHQKGDDTRTGDDTHHTDHHRADHDGTPDDAINVEMGDDGDDTPVDYTAFYPPLDFEKREEEEEIESKKERVDREEKVSSPSSPSSHSAAIPDDFTFEDTECPQCGCGIYHTRYGSPSCARCNPPAGYHVYSHLVDEMYPKKSIKLSLARKVQTNE